jgi:hypothetical protein
MTRPNPVLRVWLAIVSLAIVAMPVNGAHLHLCFDGGEPPATVHSMQDGGVHHEDGGDGAADSVHHDLDVSIPSSALVKKFKGSGDLPALIAAAFVLFRVPAVDAAVPAPDRAAMRVPRPLVRILPPSRAPPV